MTPACRRCPTPKMPLITTARAKGFDGEEVVVEVALCQSCRQQAGKENTEALARKTGKDVSK